MAIGASLLWFLCPFDIPQFFFLFITFFLSRYHKIVQAYLEYFLFQSCNLPFLWEFLVPLVGESYLETHIWILGLLIATGVPLLLGLSAGTTRTYLYEHMYIPTRTYTHTHIYTYLCVCAYISNTLGSNWYLWHQINTRYILVFLFSLSFSDRNKPLSIYNSFTYSLNLSILTKWLQNWPTPPIRNRFTNLSIIFVYRMMFFLFCFVFSHTAQLNYTFSKLLRLVFIFPTPFSEIVIYL